MPERHSKRDALRHCNDEFTRSESKSINLRLRSRMNATHRCEGGCHCGKPGPASLDDGIRRVADGYSEGPRGTHAETQRHGGDSADHASVALRLCVRFLFVKVVGL